jgi:hypothetical protein
MVTKESLHRLIEELPDEALPAIEQYIVSVRDDPVLRAALLAPEDDEELSPEEEAKMLDAWGRHARGEGRSVGNAELARRIGG